MKHVIHKTRSLMATASILTMGAVAPLSSLAQRTEITTPAITPTNPAAAKDKSNHPFPEKNMRWIRVEPPLPEDIKTAGLYFEFLDSPAYTEQFRQALTQNGYQLGSKEAAKYKIVVRGKFESRGKKQFSADIGKALEGSLNSVDTQKEKGQSLDWGKKLSSNAVTAYLSKKSFDAALMSRIYGGGTVFESVFRSLGVADKFNEWIAGDRRGFCLGTCKTWQWSSQRATLFLLALDLSGDKPRGKEMGRISAGIHSATLWPQELIAYTLAELNRYFGLIDMPEPAAPAVMDKDQIKQAEKEQETIDEE